MPAATEKFCRRASQAAVCCGCQKCIYLEDGLSRRSLEGLLEIMIWAAAVELSLPRGRHYLPWLFSAAWIWKLKPVTGCMCIFSWLQQAGLKIHGGPTSFAPGLLSSGNSLSFKRRWWDIISPLALLSAIYPWRDLCYGQGCAGSDSAWFSRTDSAELQVTPNGFLQQPGKLSSLCTDGCHCFSLCFWPVGVCLSFLLVLLSWLSPGP